MNNENKLSKDKGKDVLENTVDANYKVAYALIRKQQNNLSRVLEFDIPVSKGNSKLSFLLKMYSFVVHAGENALLNNKLDQLE